MLPKEYQRLNQHLFCLFTIIFIAKIGHNIFNLTLNNKAVILIWLFAVISASFLYNVLLNYCVPVLVQGILQVQQ